MGRAKQSKKLQKVESSATSGKEHAAEHDLSTCFESLAAQCGRAAFEGLAHVLLPGRQFEKLAGLLEAVVKGSCTNGHDCSIMEHFGPTFDDTYKACKELMPELAAPQRSSAAEVCCFSDTAKENLKFAASLLATWFRTCAGLGSRAESFTIPDSMWAFAYRIANLPPGSLQASPDTQLDPLTPLWAAAHDLVASQNYASTLTTRRAVRIVAQHAGLQGIQSLAEAAENFLLSTLALGDAALQELAWEVWTESFKSCRAKPAPLKLGNRAVCFVPSGHARVLLRATSNACITAGVSLTAEQVSENGTVDAKAVCAAAKQRAEDWAAASVENILRQCVLSEDRDAEASWPMVERLVSELLACCSLAQWPAAPVLLLCISKGLKRISTASKSTEIHYQKREFATKLLGQIATDLSTERLEAETCGSEGFKSAVTDVVAWGAQSKDAAGKKAMKQELSTPEKVLMSYVSHTSLPVAAVLSPSTKSMESLRTLLRSMTQSACAALALCEYLPATDVAREVGANGKRARTKKGTAEDQASKLEADQDWVIKSMSSLFADPSLLSTEEVSTDDRVRKQVRVLHIADMHKRPGSSVARTLSVALEALVLVLEASPFAFVRRQAAASVGHASEANTQLIMTKRVREAISAALQDDSPLVRTTVVDFLGRLLVKGQPSGKKRQSAQGALPDATKAELHSAVRARLNDSVPCVRKAAFRVECEALHPSFPGLVPAAAELLRQIRYEEEAVRTPVLAALEKALLPPPPTETALGHLADLARSPGVGAVGLQSVLTAHKRRCDPKVFQEGMSKVAAGSAGRIALWRQSSTQEDPSKWAVVLVQVASVCPSSCFALMKELQNWLEGEAPEESQAAVHGSLQQQACRVLSETLPAWAEESKVKTATKVRVGKALAATLEPLLHDQHNGIMRSAAECLCVISSKVTHDATNLMQLASDAVVDLDAATTRGAPAAAQTALQRQAWLLASILEFLDEDAQDESDMAEVAAKLLCLLYGTGIKQWQACVLPCMGFILRRHHTLLLNVKTSKLVLDAMQTGLRGDSTKEGKLLQLRSLEVLASLLSTYDKRLEEGLAPQAGRLSEAVQGLANLQGVVLQALLLKGDGAPGLPLPAAYAIDILHSFHRWGVAHPSALLPYVLGACVAGDPLSARSAQRLLLSMATASSQLFVTRFGAGMAVAGSTLRRSFSEAKQEACFEAEAGILSDSWRFSAVATTCSECFESLRARLQLLEAILTDVLDVAAWGGGRKPMPEWMPTEDSALRLQLSLLAELGAAVLVSLPLRCDAEVASILRSTSDFLTLHVAPLLLEQEAAAGHSAADKALGKVALLSTCAVALMLNAACNHLCREGQIPRLLRATLEGDSAATSQRSAPSKTMPALGVLRRELLETEGNESALMDLLRKHLALSSPLIRGAHGSAASPPLRKATLETPAKVEQQGKKRRNSKQAAAEETAAKVARC